MSAPTRVWAIALNTPSSSAALVRAETWSSMTRTAGKDYDGKAFERLTVFVGDLAGYDAFRE